MHEGGLMTAPMVVIELVLMGAMYGNREMNVAMMAVAVVVLGVFWMVIREQLAITDRQFLRSMIPHHAGAILMCEKAPTRDPETRISARPSCRASNQKATR
jgi:uncharacterized protein (DUF305 family)